MMYTSNAEMLLGLGLRGDTRDDYLRLVVLTGVATDEERAEYRELYRANVLRTWERHAMAVESERARKREEIVQHEERAMRLRRLGEYDFAVKREEYILFLKRRLDDPRCGPFNYRSLSGWGDEALRAAKDVAA